MKRGGRGAGAGKAKAPPAKKRKADGDADESQENGEDMETTAGLTFAGAHFHKSWDKIIR